MKPVITGRDRCSYKVTCPSPPGASVLSWAQNLGSLVPRISHLTTAPSSTAAFRESHLSAPQMTSYSCDRIGATCGLTRRTELMPLPHPVSSFPFWYACGEKEAEDTTPPEDKQDPTCPRTPHTPAVHVHHADPLPRSFGNQQDLRGCCWPSDRVLPPVIVIIIVIERS